MTKQLITEMNGPDIDGHGSDDPQRGDYSKKGSSNMAGKSKMKSESSPAPWAKGGGTHYGESGSHTQQPGQSASIGGKDAGKFAKAGGTHGGSSASHEQKPGQSASIGGGGSGPKFASGGGGKTSGKQQSLVAAAGRVRPQ